MGVTGARPAGPTRTGVDQTAADADQAASDADQKASDADQAASEIDQAGAASDQRASDHDQAIADREHAAHPHVVEEDIAYDAARGERQTVSVERQGTRQERARTAADRDDTSSDRDRVADERDDRSRVIAADVDPSSPTNEGQAILIQRLEALAAQAAADRVRAAADRARAATDRATAARERARLVAELDRAHLDDLTGAFRRELGRQALANEIDRARRADGRFVLAFIDIDDLKLVNDWHGHAAGDRALKGLVRVIRSRLRSFDPIFRFGGDEFVCGVSGTDLAEAATRFEAIRQEVVAEVGVGISVGLAALAPGDTVDDLIDKADAAMLVMKAEHHSGLSSPLGSFRSGEGA